MELPDKLSDLLDLAVKDCKICEKDDYYVLNMNSWHMYDGGLCYVCMAGAVMAQTMGVPFNHTTEMKEMPDEIYKKLSHINTMRIGSIPLEDCDQEIRRNFGNLIRPIYKEEKTGRADWEHYTKAAEYLRSVGL